MNGSFDHMELNEQKLNYLESQGLEIEEYDLREYVSFVINGYSARIDFDDFEIDDCLDTIEKYADLYSCCGDILDKDYMICPTCKEHC